MDDAAMPLPNEETTPPVTNMYLAIRIHPRQRSLEQLRHSLQVLRRVHAYRFILGFYHANLVAVLERPKLLEPLGPLQRTRGKFRVAQQEIPPVDIEADVLVVHRPTFVLCLLPLAFSTLPHVGHGGPRKIDRILEAVRHHFHYIRIGDFARVFYPFLER